jgi:hypothetical protein
MRVSILFSICLLTALSVSAQQADSVRKLSDYYVDLSVPDLAISGLMDITSNNVYKPGNYADFAWQIYNSVESKSGTGYGMEIPLSSFINKEKFDLDYYDQHKGLFNTRLSFGLSNSTEGLNLAAGMKFNLFNNADPFSGPSLIKDISDLQEDFLKAIEGGLQSYKDALKPLLTKLKEHPDLQMSVTNVYDLDADTILRTETERDALWNKLRGTPVTREELNTLHLAYNLLVIAQESAKATFLPGIDKAKKDFSAKHWNSSFMSTTYGVLWSAGDGRFSSLRGKKWQLVWAWGFPVLDDLSQIVLNTQFTGNISGTTHATGDSSDPALDQRNKLFIGGRWLFKLNKADHLVTTNLFLEGGYTETSFYNQELQKAFTGVLGMEFRLFSRFWVQGGMGIEDDDGKFQISLKQNITEKSRF